MRSALEDKERVRWVDGFARVNELAERLPDTCLTYIADRKCDLYDLFVDEEWKAVYLVTPAQDTA